MIGYLAKGKLGAIAGAAAGGALGYVIPIIAPTAASDVQGAIQNAIVTPIENDWNYALTHGLIPGPEEAVENASKTINSDVQTARQDILNFLGLGSLGSLGV